MEAPTHGSESYCLWLWLWLGWFNDGGSNDAKTAALPTRWISLSFLTLSAVVATVRGEWSLDSCFSGPLFRLTFWLKAFNMMMTIKNGDDDDDQCFNASTSLKVLVPTGKGKRWKTTLRFCSNSLTE